MTVGIPLFCAALTAALIAVYWPEPSSATVTAALAMLLVAEDGDATDALAIREVVLLTTFDWPITDPARAQQRRNRITSNDLLEKIRNNEARGSCRLMNSLTAKICSGVACHLVSGKLHMECCISFENQEPIFRQIKQLNTKTTVALEI